MKDYLKVKREYSGLDDGLKGGHLIKCGTFLTTNIGVFVTPPYAGTVILADGESLNILHALRETSEEAMAAWVAKDIECAAKMEKIYNYVDEIANGSSVIIAQAGLNSSSDNTTRVGAPLNFSNLKYSPSLVANKIKVEWKSDETGNGSVTFTSEDMSYTIEQSGPSQLKLTIGTSVIYIDFTTKSTVLISNLVGGSLVKTRVIKFNTNGTNELAVMQTIRVPQALI